MKYNTRRVSKDYDFPAPVGGWRTDVTLSDMPKDSAAVLDNFFPEATKVGMRRGYASWSTGLVNSINTLIPYNGTTNKLFAAAGANIFDVTVGGAVGAAAVSCLGSSRWNYANFANSAGTKYLRLVNGVDTPLAYDGTTWGTSPAITGTGLTPANLLAVTTYRSRLWFIEKNTTKIWYLTTDAVGGAATALDVGNVMKRGGSLVAMDVWSIPVATGINQSLVLMSSQGELIIYQGSNPADPANWSLLGVFLVGKPLGDRPLRSIGGDLAILCQDGVVPISKAITLDRSTISNQSLTEKITPTWKDAVADAGALNGWQIEIFPQRLMVIINVPLSSSTVQYVMNSVTGAWCRFTNIAATCWTTWNDKLFFGTSSGVLYQAETGSLDGTLTIDGLLVGAYNRLNSGFSQKQAKMLSMSLNLGTNSKALAGVSVDYITKQPTSNLTAPTITASRWGSAIWGISTFTGQKSVRRVSTAAGVGIAFAPTLRGLISGDNSSTSVLDLIGGSMAYETGNPV